MTAKKSQNNISNREKFLISTIVLLLITVFGFIFFLSNIQKIVPQNPSEQLVELQNPPVQNPLPEPIEKTKPILQTEKSINVLREITKKSDTQYVITAKLENLANIDSRIILQDLVETIKFDKNITILDGNISAKRGYLFPPDDKINISYYGPGPQSQKKTEIIITLLDINLDNTSTETELYTLEFNSEDDIKDFYFEPLEIRSDKYIIKTPAKNLSTGS